MDNRLDTATAIPLQPREPDCPIPLTPFQLLTWRYLEREASLRSARMCTTSVRISGRLDVELLTRSIEAVVQRHESLRTTFVAVEGIPRQHVDAPRAYALHTVDLANLGLSSAEQEVARLAEMLVKEKVHLSCGPLFEARLFKLSARDHVLVFALDHLISDGTSLGILQREIWTLYHQASRAIVFSLPPLPIQFGDYCVWAQKTSESWIRKHEPYWRDRLTSAPPVRIPRPYDSEDKKLDESSLLIFTLEHELTAGLRAIAVRQRTLLPLVACTVYLAVMSRWCDQKDLLLIFLSNGRDRWELQSMIGLIATVLHLRVIIEQDDTFLSLLQQVNREFHQALCHADSTRMLEAAPGWTPPNTELSFNWVRTYGRRPTSDDGFAVGDNLRLRAFPLKVTFPALFGPIFSDNGARIELTMRYLPSAFPENVVKKFWQHFCQFAQEFIRDPLLALKDVHSLE